MNKTAKNSFVYLSGTIIMALLGFANTMLLTRVLSQKVYAMYGLLVSFNTTCTMLVSFGYDKAYMRFYYSSGYSKRRFLLKCIQIPAIVMAVLFIICVEPSQLLINYIFGEKLIFITILLVCCHIVVTVINKFTHLTARMEECAVNYVLSEAVGKSGFVVFVLVLIYFSRDVSFDQLIISFLIAGVLASLINLRILFRINDDPAEGEQVSHKAMLYYGIPLMLNQVLLMVIPMAEKLMVREAAGWTVLSLYTSASFIQTVIMLISHTVTNIWSPLVFKLCDQENKLKPLIHSFGLACSFIIIACLFGCILLRRWIVLLLDSKYYMVYTILPAVMYSAGISIVTLIYSCGIEIRKKTKVLILIPLLQGGLSIGLCLLLIPSLGLVGVAIATLVSTMISKGLRMFIGLKLYDSGRSEWKSAVLIALGGVVSVASLFFISLESDLLMAFGLMILVLIIANKEIIEIMKILKSIVSSRNKTGLKGD